MNRLHVLVLLAAMACTGLVMGTVKAEAADSGKELRAAVNATAPPFAFMENGKPSARAQKSTSAGAWSELAGSRKVAAATDSRTRWRKGPTAGCLPHRSSAIHSAQARSSSALP